MHQINLCYVKRDKKTNELKYTTTTIKIPNVNGNNFQLECEHKKVQFKQTKAAKSDQHYFFLRFGWNG